MRTASFIDGAYFGKVLTRHHGRPETDFEKLAHLLAGDHELLRTYYYDAPPWQSEQPTDEERERFGKKQGFFSALSKLPRFEVRQGRCARYWNPDRNTWNFEQKRVDVLCAVDLVRLASKNQIQRACIVAGDSDFLPAIRVAKDEGVLLELWHSPEMKEVHRDLWDGCDLRRPIDTDLVNRILR